MCIYFFIIYIYTHIYIYNMYILYIALVLARWTKALVSDTHERHAGLVLPPCDAVLHSCDVMACGSFATQGTMRWDNHGIIPWQYYCHRWGEFQVLDAVIHSLMHLIPDDSQGSITKPLEPHQKFIERYEHPCMLFSPIFPPKVLSCSLVIPPTWPHIGHAEQTLRDFGAWLRSAPVGPGGKRFVIAGNHDFWLEDSGGLLDDRWDCSEWLERRERWDEFLEERVKFPRKVGPRVFLPKKDECSLQGGCRFLYNISTTLKISSGNVQPMPSCS